MAEGFMMDLDLAMRFFRYCRMFKIEGTKARLEAVRKITARERDRATYLRDVDAFLEGKSVIKITKKGKE